MDTELDFHGHLLANGHSLETAKTYVAALRIFGRFHDPASAERPDVERYLAREFGRIARNSVAGRLAALRAYFEFCGRPEVTAGLRVKREHLAPPRPVQPDAIASLLDAATNPRDRAMITVALECGLRVSELCGIRRDDVDLTRHLLLVRGKGAKQRWVSLTARAQEALTPELPRTGAVWRTQTGQPVTAGHAKRTLARIAARAGVSTHYHLFRTTFASRFLAQTHDIDSLRVLMGHRDTTTTQRYAEFEAGDRALEQMRSLNA